ncbi:MAG TPA: thioredoxin domain-containing protein, partial [Rhizobiales bacterium]|nr:thioredoxin domain-containing protein [Hyphomicrobiales bacterium]
MLTIFQRTMKTVFLALFLLAAAPAHAGVPPQYASQPANQLTGAPSPYLVIHSHDLVNWRPWNAKTLKLAKKAGKPVFLSVGYSACHWCHVMQEESFNNPAIAKIINENFTPILVDREARPDLDETYMLATEAISGRGGWPNNVFLTPDLKPFYANVYFPPDAFRKVLNLIATDWQKDASPIEAEAERIAIILSRYFSRKAATRQITPRLLARTADAILGQYDEFNGGIGTAPKYFHAPVLSYLAFLARNQNNTRALAMFELTLKNIAAGGVRDQL